MKLLGAELTDFACLDRQFVPLRPGIQLLVGRNNAGKTAVLRGLSSLAALPVGTVQPFPAELTGYCRDSSLTFGLDILYQMEDSEAKFFQYGQSDPALQGAMQKLLAKDLQAGDALARWRFRVFCLNRLVGFLNCTFEMLHTAEGMAEGIILTKKADGKLLLRQLTFPDMVSNMASEVKSTTMNGPDGAAYPIFEPDYLSTALPLFKGVRLVNAHRVVQPRQSLQTTSTLPGDAQTLGPFLQTLQGNNREIFEQIEGFVTKVFPEFRYLNAASRENNQLSIDLTERGSGRKIPLENCGTGVEQIIALAAFTLTTPKPGLILLDEPHSYLHPMAERALVQFLHEHPEHFYVVSTHSSVLMNSVASDRIAHISAPGRPYDSNLIHTQTATILFDLGYRNSDALFYDRLVFVEGKSDKQIIPILVERDGEIDGAELARTGFPVVEGVGKGSTSVQTSVLRQEKLLQAVGRNDQPRIYLFDGDRKDDEKVMIKGTRHPVNNTELRIEFLPRPEIENYLLVPEAIAPAVREELILKGEQCEVSVGEVREQLNRLLNMNIDREPSSSGKANNVSTETKGSEILEKLYDGFSLRYGKESSGTLIAKYITASNQPAISELTALLRPLFSRRSPAV